RSCATTWTERDYRTRRPGTSHEAPGRLALCLCDQVRRRGRSHMSVEELFIVVVLPVIGLVVLYLLVRTAARNGTREALRERDEARVAEAATRQIERPEQPGDEQGPTSP